MKLCCIILGVAATLAAQSSYKYTAKGDEKTVEFTNVNYDITNSLALRVTTHSKQILGEKGVEATTTTEAWKLGVDMKQKPLYAVTVSGTESRVIEGEIFVVSRGLEDTQWWSLYNIATGAHLFDTYVPMLIVPINRESVKMRYVGLQVPEGEVKDKNLVGTLFYASSDKIIREVRITCDDPKQAEIRRSLADQTWELVRTGSTLRLSFSGNYPSPPATVNITINVVGDDLDLAQAQVPAHFKLTKR